jgi:DNA repair ATPase RecN
MQQVLNSKERNEAFLKFLVFFLVTLILVVVAVYFNFRLPVRENKMLQDEIETQRQQDMNQTKFVARMQEAIVLLDSLGKGGPNVDQINLQLNGKLAEIAGLQPKDNNLYGKMDKAIVEKFSELQSAKRTLSALQEKADKISAMEAELNTTKSQLIQANADLDAYRRQPAR